MSARFERSPCQIPGAFLLRLPLHLDARGRLVKLVHEEGLASVGIRERFVEIFATVSVARAVRGMHLQVPPAAYGKLVTCLDGEVLDVLLDLRRGSPAYRRHAAFRLIGHDAAALYVPPGVAHGFGTFSATATMLYATTHAHDPARDTGVRWDSARIAWPWDQPIVSARDAALPPLEMFESPFDFSDG
jgi:dTDP-4-dehydrorhamnose 3,5-epimerase